MFSYEKDTHYHYVDILWPPSKKEGHIAVHMLVGHYVGIPKTCATYNWRTLKPCIL